MKKSKWDELEDAEEIQSSDNAPSMLGSAARSFVRAPTKLTYELMKAFGANPVSPEEAAPTIFGQQEEVDWNQNPISSFAGGALPMAALRGLKGAQLLSKLNNHNPFSTQKGASKIEKAHQIMEQNPVQLEVPGHFIKQAQDYFEKPTRYDIDMIDRAAEGEYKPLFDTQSMISHIGREKAHEALGQSAKRYHAELMKYFMEGLRNAGKEDAAQLLEEGRPEYSKALKNKERLKKTAKMVGGVSLIQKIGSMIGR